MTTTHVGKTCPYCQTPIKPNVEIVTCPRCGIPHHRECWEENGRCTTYGCRGRLTGMAFGRLPLAADSRSSRLPADCPAELRRWNWGAFVLAPWWTYAMRQWRWFVLSLIPGVGIGVAWYLAVNGNELAWKSRYWVSPRHFADTQRLWNGWGIAMLIAAVIVVVLLLLPPAG
ncbi:MAG: RING finger protein [Armatimonadota bacterium]